MQSTLPPGLKEGRAHGSQSFRCGFYAMDPKDPCFHVQPHWHEELEMIYFEQGHFTLEINMERYQINAECLFFIGSGELHRISCEEPCLESALVFSPQLLSFASDDDAQLKLLRPLAHKRLLLPRSLSPGEQGFGAILTEYHRITEFFREPGRASLPSETRQLYIKASLLGILAVLAEQDLLRPSAESQNASVESIKTVLSYIHAHYGEKITIGNLASLLSLNEQYFCRFFKKAIGQTPIAYVNEYRIRQAVSLLADSDLPVTEICLECGFNNFGNFLREFKKQTGTTPLKYRQTLRRKTEGPPSPTAGAYHHTI